MRNKALVIFFVLILVSPNILWRCVNGYIDTVSAENRALSEKPELNLAGLSSYPDQYENYYNDHLPFKNQLAKLRSIIGYQLLHMIDSKKVLLGENNWLFYKSACVEELADEQPIADYQGINRYMEEEMQGIADNINAVDLFLAGRNIDFSVLICPNKETIYSEFLPDSIKKVEEESKAEALIRHLESNTDTPIFYPEQDLMDYKDLYQLYYKYDTHWNSLAGFAAEQVLREYYCGVKESMENYRIVSVNDAVPKDLADMVNLGSCFCDDSYFYIDNYKPEVNMELIEKSEDGILDVYHSNAKDDRRILVIRDSYGEALMNYLSKDFQDVIYVHREGFDQGFIDVYQPDLVFYQVVERATNDLFDLKHIFGIQ